MEKAIKFILKEQEPDGSWFGRWGVNYIYGTFLVLRGLDAIGVDHLEPQIQQGAEWIRMVQNPDGGWGETCGSYDDPNTRGVGPSTPSQTAWALLGLLAAGDDRSDSLAKGVRWLLTRQQADGSWASDPGDANRDGAVRTAMAVLTLSLGRGAPLIAKVVLEPTAPADNRDAAGAAASLWPAH